MTSLLAARQNVETLRNLKSYDAYIQQMRAEEFPTLKDTVYLDHAGTTLYPKTLIEDVSKELTSNLFGNPHSASASSQRTTRRIDDIRWKVLQQFNADPDHFDVVFVANATAGIKLIADCLRDHDRGFGYKYHKDSHTSLVGVRELSAEGHYCFNSDELEFWLNAGQETSTGGISSEANRPTLYAYPAQSNFNGQRLPLAWSDRIRSKAQSAGHEAYVLLDAAALLSTSPLDLSGAAGVPDFTVLSFYKMFGYPDLGAIIVRKESAHVLRSRKYFGGGTVEMVSCRQEQWHIKKVTSIHDQLEDGTLPFHSIMALENAMRVHTELFGTLEQVSAHCAHLALKLHEGLIGLRHLTGSPVCELYQEGNAKYSDVVTQGPIVAFNMRNSQGEWVSNAEVEKLATIKHIHIRSGGLCNPGGVASFLKLGPWEMRRNFSSGQRCTTESEIIGGKPTGALRVSLGAMSTLKDVQAFVEFIEEFFVDKTCSTLQSISESPVVSGFYIESLKIYPIKSCASWSIPNNLAWDIRPEGLAWDREWCLVHQGTRSALSQKRFPKMALFRPSLDLSQGFLRVRYTGVVPDATPSEIDVPLSADPSVLHKYPTNSLASESQVCGDDVQIQTYGCSLITSFFTNILGVPCYLARFPPHGTGRSARHSKPNQTTAKTKFAPNTATPALRTPYPLLLSNESPILAISRSSLNRLNEIIKSKSPPGKAASAEVFRANLILAEDRALPSAITELPYIEDSWSSIHINGDRSQTAEHPGIASGVALTVFGPCRRCQMVCVDQSTAEKNEEPFITLAKTRRIKGQVNFGMHMGLSDGMNGIQGRVMVGDKIAYTLREDDGQCI
ncbi:hypothetical protein MMC25_000122 [Agyrium rufum]|nr:hypothetical protein [Agyrium rufum]